MIWKVNMHIPKKSRTGKKTNSKAIPKRYALQTNTKMGDMYESL